MILTDREISLAIDQKTLVIDPRPSDDAFASTSVDLTLDPIVSEFKDSSIDRHFDPGRKDYPLEQVLGEATFWNPESESSDGHASMLIYEHRLGWQRGLKEKALSAV